ncbi:GspE/PulE family protein [Alicyclobacillus vulcanalis]|uniref:General secretion pathway protein E/type IV pilus assembly protein PilB n=1 Tax=Alicyclobacillus vulcanalis TaxID=252246 RepID=A0A1N7KPK4_9BACL|nr:ATPase, T2SS/T4P/T4SS family [Alicyclobacillus vulcanalis]SIS63572.1 general secretion pathway protein E/type IV pilus assembly protein PilB [Alicyclobacillus vulcanalis]
MDKMTTAQIVDGILTAGIRARASDIHLYLAQGFLHVSFRVAGAMVPFLTGLSLGEETVRRLKAMARMDVTVRHTPQEGSFQWIADDHLTHFRASCVPVFGGESLVLRLFHDGLAPRSLEDLGLSSALLSRIQDWLRQDGGLIALAGRTGAGKTTAAYAMLAHVLRHGRSVLTLEEPVEVRVPGCRQIEIQDKHGLTFDAALRAMVRQDPDVIFVGEVRDEMSATAACRAAMSGRLVLATVHARRPMGVIARFLDLGVSSSVLEEVLTGVVFVEAGAAGGDRSYRAVGAERLFHGQAGSQATPGRALKDAKAGQSFASAR